MTTTTTKQRPQLKLGKLPARPGAVKMAFSRYATLNELPTPPTEFGHEKLIKTWGMMLNDRLGDCAVVGPQHETMLLAKESGHTVTFNDDATVQNYREIGGYNPDAPPLPDGSNPTDGGCDMSLVASARRQTGIVDAAGNRHKTIAYTALEPGNLNQLLVATYLFSAVGVGVILTEAQMEQFNEGKPWDVVRGAKEIGGHYIPIFGRRNGLLWAVTWGKLHPITPRFYTSQNDESTVSFSEEMLIKGQTLEGFNDVLLIGDLKAITA